MIKYFNLIFIIALIIYTGGCCQRIIGPKSTPAIPAATITSTPAATQTPVIIVVTATVNPTLSPTGTPQATQTPVIIVVTPTHAPVQTVVIVVTPTPSEEYIASAQETLDALDTLNSLIDIGATRREYRDQLLSAKIALNRFNNQSDDQVPGLRTELESAMDNYEGAADKIKAIWLLKSKGTFPVEAQRLRNGALDNLIKAREHTTKAHNLFNRSGRK